MASAAELLGVTRIHDSQTDTSGVADSCVQIGTIQAARWSNVETAEKGDMWALATRGMHMAGQELSELLAFRKKANNDNATRWVRIKVARAKRTGRTLPSLMSHSRRDQTALRHRKSTK